MPILNTVDWSKELMCRTSHEKSQKRNKRNRGVTSLMPTSNIYTIKRALIARKMGVPRGNDWYRHIITPNSNLSSMNRLLWFCFPQFRIHTVECVFHTVCPFKKKQKSLYCCRWSAEICSKYCEITLKDPDVKHSLNHLLNQKRILSGNRYFCEFLGRPRS